MKQIYPELQKQIELSTVVGENKVLGYKPPTAEPQILSEITNGIHQEPYWPRAKLTEEQEAQVKALLNKQTESVSKVATKFDENKLNWGLLPFESLEEVVKVMEFGATKYAPNNWKYGKGLGTLRVLNSCLRHLFAYLKGEKVDPETGISHLAHASCNLLFALYYEKYKEKYLQDGVIEKNT